MGNNNWVENGMAALFLALALATFFLPGILVLEFGWSILEALGVVFLVYVAFAIVIVTIGSIYSGIKTALNNKIREEVHEQVKNRVDRAMRDYAIYAQDAKKTTGKEGKHE